MAKYIRYLEVKCLEKYTRFAAQKDMLSQKYIK